MTIMKEYVFALLCASLLITLIGILAPAASAAHMRLICGLCFLCMLAAPLPSLIRSLSSLSTDWKNGMEQDLNDQYRDQTQQALEGASKTYFAQTLTTLLEERFSIPTGEVRCTVLWSGEDDTPKPQRITVILSGSAIWKDPAEIEETVTSLLGCECVTAIERSR